MQQRPFSDYDRRAWDDAERARERDVNRKVRRVIPQAVREPIARGGREVAARAKDLPGADVAGAVVREVLESAMEALSMTAGATLPTGRVLTAYADAGYQLGGIADIQRLRLEQIDQVRPGEQSRYARYVGSGVTSGAVAGLTITSGEVVAASGIGAAPGSVAVLSAMAGDAIFTTSAATRAILESALFHGFDITRPEEKIRGMSVLNAATATGAVGKQGAYRQLDQLVNLLIRHGTTWAQLDRNVVALIIKKALSQQAERVTKAKLASVVPLAGIALGAAFNARLLHRAIRVADYSYRRWLLIEQYGITVADDTDSVAGDIPFIELPPDAVQDFDGEDDADAEAPKRPS